MERFEVGTAEIAVSADNFSRFAETPSKLTHHTGREREEKGGVANCTLYYTLTQKTQKSQTIKTSERRTYA
jgi:hypothetical protein